MKLPPSSPYGNLLLANFAHPTELLARGRPLGVRNLLFAPFAPLSDNLPRDVPLLPHAQLGHPSVDRRPAPPARAFPPGPSGVGAADYLDLSAAPDSGPVGGRLQQFTRAWESITSDGWVLATVSLGYSLEFTSTPPSNPVLRPTPVPTEYPKRESLESEIEALLQKRAIRPVPTKSWGRGFTSTFFLTPKKEPGAWRPIINLRPLNRFIRPKKFRMETIKSVIQSLSLPAWASSIDLKDAYLHVPIHPRDFEYLRFFYNGRLFEFTALPFGLSTSPRVFTRIAKTVAAFLRRNGVQIYQYLDDWLIVGGSHREALSATRQTCQLASRLGFIINREKSNLSPSQLPTYLGAVLDLRRGIVSPTPLRIDNLIECTALLAAAKEAPAHAWLRLLGLMASMVDLVPFCRLQMRPLQLLLLSFFRPKSDSLDLSVPVTDVVRPCLDWWLYRPNLEQGLPFQLPRPEVTITTDASRLGWGASMPPHHASGVWDLHFQGCHINVLELQAVFNALCHFRPFVSGKHVLVRSDNSTVVAYINHQGGTRSPRLCLLTRDLYLWAWDHHVSLQAIHIPGVDNSIADALSRGKIRPTEWSLHRGVAEHLFAEIEKPNIDLFASAENAQLPVFCTRFHDPRAWASDALQISWEGMSAYAFPPISLVSRVLCKLEREPCRLLLIAPFWPRQHWFPRLIRLLAGIPITLPSRPDLLLQPKSGFLHPDPDNLHLTCWPLSSDPSVRQAFLRKLQTWPLEAGAAQPETSTAAGFDILLPGAQGGIWIQPRPL